VITAVTNINCNRVNTSTIPIYNMVPSKGNSSSDKHGSIKKRKKLRSDTKAKVKKEQQNKQWPVKQARHAKLFLQRTKRKENILHLPF